MSIGRLSVVGHWIRGCQAIADGLRMLALVVVIWSSIMNTYMVANGVAIHSASDMPRSGAEYAGAPLENINTTKDVEQEHEPSNKKGGFVAPVAGVG